MAHGDISRVCSRDKAKCRDGAQANDRSLGFAQESIGTLELIEIGIDLVAE
jgi:hypothetical protein